MNRTILFLIILFLYAPNEYSTDVFVDQYFDYTLRNADATYTTARDDTDASNDSNGNFRVGQATGFNIDRAFAQFTIPALDSCATAVLYLWGDEDNSTTDFYMQIFTADAGGSFSKVDFDTFDGWTSGSAHTGTSLIDAGEWSSVDMVVDNWNRIEFNAAGRAAVFASADSILQIAMLSKEDVDRSEPTDSEQVVFKTRTEHYAAFLRINDTNVIGRDISSNEGYVAREDAAYTTARDPATGESVSPANIAVGPQIDGDSDFWVYRSFFEFSIPAMSAWVAGTLWVNGTGADYSTDNFAVFIHEADDYAGSIAVVHLTHLMDGRME